MGRYVSPSYLATSYVTTSWFGGGSLVPLGNYLGTGYIAKRYLARGYVLLDSFTPSNYYVLDSVSVGISDIVAQLLVKRSSSDTLSVSVDTAFTIGTTRSVFAADTIAITLGEARTPLVKVSKADTLGVSFTENVIIGGSLVFKAANDQLDLEINEVPTEDVRIETGDGLALSVSETKATTVFLSRSDTLSLAVSETEVIAPSGTVLKSAVDSLGISLGEISAQLIFKNLSSTDTLDIALVEVQVIQEGVVVQYLQAFDSLGMAVTEASYPVVAVDTETKIGSDTLNITLADTSQRIDLIFVSSGDALAIMLVDSGSIAKVTINPTWEDAGYPWGGSTLKSLKPLPVFSKGFDFIQAELSETFIDGTPITVVLERLGLTLYGRDRQGNWKEDAELVKHIKGLWPIFRGRKGTQIKIYVGAQDDPEDPVTWDGPFIYTIGQDESMIDPVVSGKYIAVRFESSGQPPWVLASYKLDITKVGAR